VTVKKVGARVNESGRVNAIIGDGPSCPLALRTLGRKDLILQSIL